MSVFCLQPVGLLGRLVFAAASLCAAGADDYRITDVHAACFRPHGPSCAQMIAGAFERAQASILAEVYQFTEPTIGDALARAQERRIEVRLIVDRTTTSRAMAEQASRLHAVKVDCTARIHHDKVAIVDGRYVITGSYNWSVNAERHNDENVVLIDDTAVAAAYIADFEAQWARSLDGTRCPPRAGRSEPDR